MSERLVGIGRLVAVRPRFHVRVRRVVELVGSMLSFVASTRSISFAVLLGFADVFASDETDPMETKPSHVIRGSFPKDHERPRETGPLSPYPWQKEGG